MMSKDLFRKEVLEAKRISWLGGISLAQPTRLWILTAAALSAGIVVALLLVFGTYTRRSNVGGHLVPAEGMALVVAPSNGVVSQVNVAEGHDVAIGDTVAVVSVPRSTLARGDTTAALEQRIQRRLEGLESARSAQEIMLAAQTEGLTSQLAVARRELSQIEAELATRQKLVVIANETLGRLRQLQQDKFVSELQAQQQETTALEQLSEFQILQRQAIGTRRSISQLEQALREIPGQRQASEANHLRDVAILEQEQVETQARGEYAISAPVSGLVATLMVKPGQSVQAGQPLMSLLPGEGILEAELFIPSRSVGFIEPGDTVLLRYQAYPYQKFGHQSGRVQRISRSTLNASDPQGTNNNSEPLYRVTVELSSQVVFAYGNAEQLKPGMLLDANILGERRRLIEWIFEPLYSLRGSVTDG